MNQQNPKNILCFYSKYSENSQLLVNLAKKYNELEEIKYICVDSQNVREALQKNKNIKIESVPCVLLCYPSNYIEKYEGKWYFT